jgi:hypothetical protein
MKSTKQADTDLLAFFLKRNQRIILRKTEGTSINSINSFNQDVVAKYFDSQMFVMEKHRLVERRTIIVDKTGIYTV